MLEGEGVHLGGKARGGVFGQHDRIPVLVRGAGDSTPMLVAMPHRAEESVKAEKHHR